jgi:Uma2 family endonuclease
MMKTPVEQLIRSPRLPQYVRELERLLAEERKQREQFYDQMSEQQKAEFINGEVIIHSPVRLKHSQASDNLFVLLSSYVKRHGLGLVGHEKLLITLSRNDYEPDICYFSQAKAVKLAADQSKFPAPDLIAEVLSPSTERIDREIKLEDYAAHGVQEYWIVDPDDETIEQYLLEGEQYRLAVKVKEGIIQSAAMKGFELAVRAVFDSAEHLAALHAIMAR